MRNLAKLIPILTFQIIKYQVIFFCKVDKEINDSSEFNL